MKTKKVIDAKNLPGKLPIWSTLTTALALDHWNAPEWLWGALGLFFLIGWIAVIASKSREEQVDMFEKENTGKV